MNLPEHAPPGRLDPSRLDHTVAGLKALLGLMPFVGGTVAEIVGQVIPGQRLDRACRFLEELDARLRQLELSPAVASDPRFVDLFEDATLQSLRALSEERTTQLVSFLTEAATEGEPQFDVDKRLLQILAELSDTEIAVLRSHQGLQYVRLQREFYCEPLAVGPYERLSDSEKNAYDARRVAWEMHVHALHRLGLLRPEIRAIGPTRRDFEFDERTGLPKVDGYRMTTLGRLLLRRIGALEGPSKDAAPGQPKGD
jgi:hypothetical protein